MARIEMRERTIAFYEVVEVVEGEQRRTQQRDWQRALSGFPAASLEDRSWNSDRTYFGTTEVVEAEHQLLLHRVRDVSEWLSVVDFKTGQVEELETAAAQGYLDTTAIHFLPYGNVVAVMRGSTSAPSHKTLEGWLNHLRLFNGPPLVVRPLMRPAEVERLRGASGASKIEIRIGANKMAALQDRHGRLAGFLRRATEDFGDLTVTVTISAQRSRERRDDRRGLLDELNDLAEVMPQAADVARAHLTYEDAEGRMTTRITEFVEHDITLKRRVPAVDENGESIRIRAAFQVMIGGAAEVEDVLRHASASDGDLA